MAAKGSTVPNVPATVGPVTRTHALPRKFLLDPDLRTAKVVRELPHQTPPLSSVRSTLLASSLEALRERELFDAYRLHLPRRYHEPVLHTLAPTWLPLEVAMAHYRAIDALQIPDDEALEMGRAVGQRLHGTFLATLLRSANQAGFTPWAMVGKVERVWSRVLDGGALGLSMLGAKDAIAHVRGIPLLETRYFRTALRGVLSATIESMVTKCYVRELSSDVQRLREPDAVDVLVAWV